MGKITDGEIIQNCIRLFRLQSAENVPKTIHDIITPVVDVGNKPPIVTSRVVSTSLVTTTGNTTIVTTSPIKDTYLLGCSLTGSYDATADSNVTSLSITPYETNNSVNIIRMAKQTLTVDSQTHSREFIYPIKLARNSAIVMSNTFTLGTGAKFASLNLLEVEK
jgi:hypothetical protein